MSDELQVADLLEVEATPEPTPVAMPGSRLKAEREARGLSLTEVAHTLKFGVRQIEALEADNYELLQGSTFLRGFIRSYARYLKLEDAPLLALLEVAAPPPQAEIVAPSNMGEASTQPFIERNQKWLMLAMALVVVLAVGAYWVTLNEKNAGTDAVEAPVVKEESASAPVTANQTSVVAPTPVAITTPAATVPAAVPMPPAAPAAATPIPVPVPAAPAPTVAAPAPAKSVAPAPAAPVSASGEKQVILDFDGRSWVEIKDASQRVIFTGEYGSGTHQVVSGKPPFQLWIGKSSSVRVNYNEQKVNLQPYARDEVARLTLN